MRRNHVKFEDEDVFNYEEALKSIRNWPPSNFKELMEVVREQWSYADVGYFTSDGDVYNLSTAGWSDNEGIISALRENRLFWTLCFISERRGGHYIFELTPSCDFT